MAYKVMLLLCNGEADDLGLGGNEGSRATGNAGACIACGKVELDAVPMAPFAMAPVPPLPVPSVPVPPAQVPTFPPGLGTPVLGDKVFAHLRGRGNVTTYYGMVEFEYPTIATRHTRVTYSLEGLPLASCSACTCIRDLLVLVIAVMQTSLLVTGIWKTRIMEATLISRVTSAIWARF
jgi:hypothetical protein